MTYPVLIVGKRGRPRRSVVLSTKRLAIFVTPDEYAELKKVAAENHRPMATLIRDAVNEFVSDYKDEVILAPRGALKPDE